MSAQTKLDELLPETDACSTSLAGLFDQCGTREGEQFKPERRSIRLHGHSTTIRMEHAFWEVLEELADEEGIKVNSLITRIHDHCQDINKKNLASCLRVVCLKYMVITG